MPRNRGIKLPDAGDVQQVGFANDPGVNVPNLGIDIGGFNVDAAVDAVQRAAAKQQKLLDATKTAEAYEAFGRTTMDDFNRRRLEEDSSNPEFLKSFQGFLDQNVETALTSLPEGVSEEAKAGLRMRLSSQRNAFLDSAGQVHLGALQDKAGATIESQINTWSAQASRDPALLDGILDLADEGLEQFAGALPTAAEQKYRQAARSSIVESAISGLVDLGGLKEARALLGDERFNADLDPSRRNVLGNRIDAEQKRREAEGRAAAREQRAMFMADFRMQLEDEEAARARGTSTGLTDDTIRKALSIDQAGAKLAERTIASLNASQQLALDMTDMALMTPAEQDTLVNQYQPAGEGFKDEAGRFDALARARDTLRSQATADPALYAAQYSPTVQQSLAAASAAQDPAMLQKAIAQSLEVQANAGIDLEDQRPLTKDQAKDVVEKIKSMPGEQAADAVQGQIAAYGNHWPSVYKQLVESGLPKEYSVLATTDDPVARKAIAELLTIPEADIKPKEPGAAKDLQEATEEAFAPLFETLRHAPNGIQESAKYREVGTRLAYKYRDADRAFEEMIGNRYDFVIDDNFAARAPKGKGDTAEATAGEIMFSLKPGDLADPGGGTPETQILTPDQRRDMYLANVHRGTWVTNENDDGWLLLDQIGQPVMRADGTKVGFLFKDMPP